MANLFLSHRGADAKEAERLALELRAKGHQVWLDVWEIQIGDSIVGKIDDGLTGATYLILCYSNQGVSAPGWAVSGCPPLPASSTVGASRCSP
jgi:hypothetical protein